MKMKDAANQCELIAMVPALNQEKRLLSDIVSRDAKIISELRSQIKRERINSTSLESEIVLIGARHPDGPTNDGFSYAAIRAREIEHQRNAALVESLRARILELELALINQNKARAD